MQNENPKADSAHLLHVGASKKESQMQMQIFSNLSLLLSFHPTIHFHPTLLVETIPQDIQQRTATTMTDSEWI